MGLGVESFPGGSVVKNLPANAGDANLEDPLEREMTTHSSILAWRMLWTEEPDGLCHKESDITEANLACTHA